MEEDDIRTPAVYGLIKDLEQLSLSEMNDYIAMLETEIGRIKAEIDKRGGRLSEAEKLFRAGPK